MRVCSVPVYIACVVSCACISLCVLHSVYLCMKESTPVEFNAERCLSAARLKTFILPLDGSYCTTR